MTLLTALAWSVLRAVVVATVALLPAAAIVQRCRIRRVGVLFVALSPLFVPELLIGFTYRLTAARVAQSAAVSDLLTELLYSGILLGRAVAVIVAARLILPGSTVSQQALHSWKLLQRTNELPPNPESAAMGARFRDMSWRVTYLRLLVTGPLCPAIIGWCVAVLLCFQEFETAALLQIDRHPIAWPVWLFDAHAAGEPLGRSLSMLIVPLVLELALLCPVLWLLRSGGLLNWEGEAPAEPRVPLDVRRGSGSAGTSPSRIERQFPWEPRCNSQRTAAQPSDWPDNADLRRGASLSVSPIVFLLLIAVAFLVWPLASNVTDIGAGFAGLWKQPSLLTGSLTQIATSLSCAVAAALISLQTAVVLRSFQRWWLTLAALLPGLLGSLVLSLVLLAMFQSPVANRLYDSWLPMLLGLTLLMLPRAFLLAAVLEANARPQAVHSAKLLLVSRAANVRHFAQSLIWRLVQFRWLLAGAILVHWSFWDVTVAAILRPLQFEPVITRLYNEMHYGRTETLTAIISLSLLIPWLTAALAFGLWTAVRHVRSADRMAKPSDGRS